MLRTPHGDGAACDIGQPPSLMRDLSPAEIAMVGVPTRGTVQKALNVRGLGEGDVGEEERQVQPKKQRLLSRVWSL